MADEISNRTLALLLIVAIVVSLAGTFMSLRKLASVGFPPITGLASDEGNVTVDIQSTASIKFAVNAIDFGSGGVNSTNSQTCTIASSSTGGVGGGNTDCFGDFETASGWYSLEIENDGNVNLTVNVTSDNNAASFIGGSSALEEFWMKAENNESGSCASVTPSSWTAVTTDSTAVCTSAGGLWYDNNNDSIRLDVNITIPYDSDQMGAGAVTSTFTVEGTSV